MRRTLYTWLDERYQLGALSRFLKEKSVPVQRGTIWYFTGGVVLFFFIVQILSGILLVLYYQADEDSAYESVRFIMTRVSFGWLVRSVHSWAANLLVLFAFIHMFSTLFTGAFRKPRELTWLTGCALLALALAFGFTGYLLPWNELSFFATKVGTDIAGAIPFVGNAIKVVLRGGEDVTGATLSRFYAIHIAILPALLTLLVGLHLLFVQRQGMHVPDGAANQSGTRRRSMPFFPNFFLRDVLLWLIVLNVLLVLSVFFPWELGQKADLFSPAPEGIRPEWYFMFMFQTLKLLPAHVLFMEGEVFGVVAFALLAAAWLFLPFWEGKVRGKGGMRTEVFIGVTAIVYILVLTVWGYLV